MTEAWDRCQPPLQQTQRALNEKTAAGLRSRPALLLFDHQKVRTRMSLKLQLRLPVLSLGMCRQPATGVKYSSLRVHTLNSVTRNL